MADNFIYDGDQFNGAVPSGVTSGDPTLYGGILPVVALTDRDGAGLATVRAKGVFELSVKGVDDDSNVAVSVGDRLYWTTGDTPKINKKISGALFGIAMEAVGSGATATIKVRLAGLAGAGENALAAHIADPASAAAITAVAPAALTYAAPAALTSAALTENGGAIGGTNDGDAPTPVDPAGDAGASLIAYVRELAAALNEVAADVLEHDTALRAAGVDLGVIRTPVVALVTDVTAVRTGSEANNTAIDSILAAADNRWTESS